MSTSELVLKLFLQLIVILIICRSAAFVGKRYFGQPAVVCEMVAGIILGPSLIGLFFPTFEHWLFPTERLLLNAGNSIPNPSMSILFALSQIGLVLYMFLVGMHFDLKVVRKKIKSPLIIAGMGIVFPFTLAIIAGIFVIPHLNFFNPNIPVFTKTLFFGLALSISAFPVLARILEDKAATQTHFGVLTLGSASLDDVFAWILLGFLMSTLNGNNLSSFIAILGTCFFIIVLFIIKKPLQKYLTNKDEDDLTSSKFGFILVLLFVAAWLTNNIGIYYVFGAFTLGLIIPRNGKIILQLQQYLSNFTKVVLLPVFFVYTGLNTQINLINSWDLCYALILILAIAIIGKGVGCCLGAKFAGENWSDSARIGILMNTRGLMELIFINIGLQKNIINHELFTILVIMAVVTTLMTSPLFNLFYNKKQPMEVSIQT